MAFIACSTTKVSPRVEKNEKFSILQLHTTENTSYFRVVYPKGLKLNFIIKDNKSKVYSAKVIKKVQKSFSPFAVAHLKVTGLSRNKTYELQVKSSKVKWQDRRTFKTLDLNNKSYKVAVASCMYDAYNEQGNIMWPKLFSHNPDLLFMIGDNIYSDTFSYIYLGNDYMVDPRHLWTRHVDHAMKLKVYRMDHLTPTYTTWDDHDFGVNNGGKNYRYKKQAAQIFRLFFPNYASKNNIKGPGISSSLKLGKMSFHFLDNRTFRDPDENNQGDHYGKKQTNWLLQNLNQYNIIIGGDQFFGGYHKYESFEGNHPIRFKSFLNSLKTRQKKLAFLSGDRHLIEHMKVDKKHLGFSTYEYTVSGIHTKTFPGSLERIPNPSRIGGFDGKVNYAIFDFSYNKKNQLLIDFDAYSQESKEYSSADAI
jgi:alkaline phosphatase D